MRIAVLLCGIVLCYSCAVLAAPAAKKAPPAKSSSAVSAVVQQAQKLRDASQFAAAQKRLEARLKTATKPGDKNALQIALADVHYRWADNLAKQYQWNAAIQHYQAACALDKTLRPKEAAIGLNNIGLVYHSLSRYQEALTFFQQALLIRQHIGDRAGEAVTLNNIGLVYSSLSRYEEALECFQRALPILHKIGDKAVEAVTLNNIGLVYQGQGRFDDALKFYQQALSILRQVGDGTIESRTLNNIGMVYQSQGSYDKALECFQRALPILHKIGDKEGEATTLNNIGMAYQGQSHSAKALECFQRALLISRQIGFRRGESATLGNIGAIHQGQSHYEEALKFYQQALAIIQQAGDSTTEAAMLNVIGLVYRSLSRYAEALTCFQRALSIFQQIGDKAGEAGTLSNIGVVYQNQSRYEEALNILQQALPMLRQIGMKVAESRTLNNIGMVYQSQGRYDEAFKVFQQALPIARQTDDKDNEATTLNNIGLVCAKLSRFEEALNCWQQALPIFKQMGGKAGEGTTLNNIGEVYRRLSRYDDALDVYQQSWSIFQQIGDKALEATTLNNIGLIYQDQGRYEEALNVYQRALPIFRQIGYREGEGTTLNNVGYVYFSLSHYEEALKFFQQALPLQQQIGDRAGEATTFNNIGLVYEGQNRYGDALNAYQQALLILRQIGYREGEATALSNLMAVSGEQQQPGLAVFYGKQSVNVTQDIRRSIHGLSKEIQQGYLKLQQSTYEVLAELLIEQGRLPEAEQVTRLLKEQEVFDYVRRDATRAGLTENIALTPTERDWVRRYDELGEQAATIGRRMQELEKASQKTSPDYQKLLQDQEALNGRWIVFRKELAATFAKPLREQVDVAASGAWQDKLAELEASGAGRAALLYAFIGSEHFYVTLTLPRPDKQHDNRLSFSYPIKPGEVHTLISDFRKALTSPASGQPQDPAALAQRLHQVVFCNGAVERALQANGVQVALWYLNGALRYVPLDALHDGEKYLVERLRLNVVMSLTSRDYVAQPPQGGTALGAGTGETHDVADSELPDAPKIHFPALPAVGDELRGIINNPPQGATGPLPGEMLLNGAFSARALQAALRTENCHTLHVATHFRLEPGSDDRSFLVLGDNRPLRVEEWQAQMPLGNLDLLTLSACETGLGGADSAARPGEAKDAKDKPATGAEVGSLGEIAQLQGAKAVIVSLWSVADPSTARLMREFYAQWRANPQIGKGEALRRAQRLLLRGGGDGSADGLVDASRGTGLAETEGTPTGAPPFKKDAARPFAHPYYWAPFFLIGNWR